MRRSLQIPGLRQGGRLTVSEGAPRRLIGSSSPARLFLVRGRLTATDGAREAGRHGAWERREQASPRGYAWFRGSCQSSCAVWEGGRLDDGDLMVLQNSLIRFHRTLHSERHWVSVAPPSSSPQQVTKLAFCWGQGVGWQRERATSPSLPDGCSKLFHRVARPLVEFHAHVRRHCCCSAVRPVFTQRHLTLGPPSHP